jgi:hypothetical protein
MSIDCRGQFLRWSDYTCVISALKTREWEMGSDGADFMSSLILWVSQLGPCLRVWSHSLIRLFAVSLDVNYGWWCR